MTGESGRESCEARPEELPELPLSDAGTGVGIATFAGSLGERYLVVERLGAGAFGEVYRAHDRVLGRDVAIKRVRLEAFADPAQLDDAKQRFLREAQVAARLRHPNIVTTHDILSTPQTSAIVMELIEGRTLQSILDERRRLPVEETTAILEKVAAALDHAHANKVVHRDVKPANVMVEPSGQVKVMDFGIAKIESGGNLTASGAIMGTPNYMSPEQARGERVDARSDLFSLGCVLYECLTGVRPFQADSVGLILVKILTEDPPPIDFAATRLPLEMAGVLRRATAKDPGARFNSGAEMTAAVQAAARGNALPDAPAVLAKPTGRAPARNRRLLLTGAIGLLLLLTAGGTVVDRILRSRPGATLSAHVVEEPRGLVDRVLGRKPRLRVTLPEGTRLKLTLETPLRSETAKAGANLAAAVSGPVRIEDVLAVPRGSAVSGRVARAASAAEAAGRGEMVLAFDALKIDGQSVAIHTKPLALRAPPLPKKKTRPQRNGDSIGETLSQVGGALGNLIERIKAGSDVAVQGGSADALATDSAQGREVLLPARAALSVELAEPLTVVRRTP